MASRRAVAKLIPLDPGTSAGTAFAIDRDLALTAYHCVGRRVDARVSLSFSAPPAEVPALAIGGDEDSDLALLRLEGELPEGVAPVALAQATESLVDKRFRAEGFGVDRPPGSDVHAIDGRVVRTDARPFDGPEALQLYSEQLAAREDPHQFSGGPVLVESEEHDDLAAVGIVRWAKMRPDAPSEAVGGTFYASSAMTAWLLWPEVRQAFARSHIATAEQRLARQREAMQPDSDVAAAKAMIDSALRLVARLIDVGRSQRAIDVLDEMTETARTLLPQGGLQTFAPVVTALVGAATFDLQMARPAEALGRAREAAALLAGLRVFVDSSGFTRQMGDYDLLSNELRARCLSLISEAQEALDSADQALIAATEALKLAEARARAQAPGEPSELVGEALRRHALALSASNRHADALRASSEAVAMFSRLEEHSASPSVKLGELLGERVKIAERAGRIDLALEAASEQVGACVEAARANPRASTHHRLGMAAQGKAALLWADDRKDEGAALQLEALAGLRSAAKTLPERYLRDLAEGLFTACEMLMHRDRDQEALELVDESLAAFVRTDRLSATVYVVPADPKKVLVPTWALVDRSELLASLGQTTDAIEASGRAVDAALEAPPTEDTPLVIAAAMFRHACLLTVSKDPRATEASEEARTALSELVEFSELPGAPADLLDVLAEDFLAFSEAYGRKQARAIKTLQRALEGAKDRPSSGRSKPRPAPAPKSAA